MFNKFKSVAVALCICLVAVLFASCGGNKEGKAEVYFLNFKPESAETYEKIAAEYEKETGVRVNVVTAAANTYEQTLKSEIAKSFPPTIFQINGPMGFNSWRDYCADLSDSKIYSYLDDKSLAISENGAVYGIPFVVEGYGIIYNNEIMNRYFALNNKTVKISSAKEITDFNTLKAVVEDMTKNKSKLGIEGVFGSTSLYSGEDWRWQTHLSNLAIHNEFKNGDTNTSLLLQNAKSINFTHSDKFKNVFDLYTNNSITDKKLLGSKSVADSMAEFALGKVAMIQNGNWAWSQISDIEGNKVKEKDIKFMPIYSGFDNEEKQGLCIGTENFLAINSKASKESKDAALEFLDWLFSSEKGKKYVIEDLKFMTPFNTFNDDETPNDPLSAEVKSWLSKEGIETVPWSFTGYPGEKFKTDFGNALLEYVQGNKKWDEVVSTVKNSWKEERE